MYRYTAPATALAGLLVALASMAIPTLAADVAKPAAKPAPPIRIHEPYARLQPPASRMTGVFMVLENQGKAADALIGASCDCAQNVELHVMKDVDGKMSMRKTERFDLAPGQRFALAPGGPHVMLIGLTKPLDVARPLSLKLRFEKAGVIEVSVPVRDPRKPR